MKTPDFYVYVYFDPSVKNKDGCPTPIYVGKGTGNRARDHLFRKDRHPLTYRLNQMKRYGWEPLIDIVQTFESEIDAYQFEIELISRFGRKDQGKGPLLNLNDGGTGGLRPSEETAKKKKTSMVRYWSIPENRKVHSEKLKAIFNTPTRIARQSELSKKMWSSETARVEQSIRLKTARARPEVKEHQRKVQTEVWSNPDLRKRATKNSTKNWKDPTYRAKVIAGSCKRCSVDGLIWYSSRKELMKDLGCGKKGRNHPEFRYE